MVALRIGLILLKLWILILIGPHRVCIIQVRQHGNLLLICCTGLTDFVTLDLAEHCKGEAELLVVSRCLFFLFAGRPCSGWPAPGL